MIYIRILFGISLFISVGCQSSISESKWQISELIVNRGDPVTFTCTTSHVNNDDVIEVSRILDYQTLTLSHNGNLRSPFNDMERFTVQHNHDGGNTNITINISGTKSEDSALYGCFRLADPDSMDIINITVKADVSDMYLATLTPEGEEVPSYDGFVMLNENERLGVECVATVEASLTHPKMSVSIDNKNVTSLFTLTRETLTATIESGLLIHYTQTRLTLVTSAPNPQFNTKQLDCYAHQPGFEQPTVASATMTVYFSPILKCDDTRILSRLGETQALNCSVQANPGSRVTWISRGEQSSSADSNVIYIREQEMVNDVTYLQLLFSPSRPENFHQYIIRADNVIGSTRLTLDLVAADQPSSETSNSGENTQDYNINTATNQEPMVIEDAMESEIVEPMKKQDTFDSGMHGPMVTPDTMEDGMHEPTVARDTTAPFVDSEGDLDQLGESTTTSMLNERVDQDEGLKVISPDNRGQTIDQDSDDVSSKNHKEEEEPTDDADALNPDIHSDINDVGYIDIVEDPELGMIQTDLLHPTQLSSSDINIVVPSPTTQKTTTTVKTTTAATTTATTTTTTMTKLARKTSSSTVATTTATFQFLDSGRQHGPADDRNRETKKNKQKHSHIEEESMTDQGEGKKDWYEVHVVESWDSSRTGPDTEADREREEQRRKEEHRQRKKDRKEAKEQQRRKEEEKKQDDDVIMQTLNDDVVIHREVQLTRESRGQKDRQRDKTRDRPRDNNDREAAMETVTSRGEEDRKKDWAGRERERNSDGGGRIENKSDKKKDDEKDDDDDDAKSQAIRESAFLFSSCFVSAFVLFFVNL